jgi:hypothetical protein
VLHLIGIDRTDLAVYSISGQQIRSAINVSELDLSGLNRGLYMVKVGNQSRVYKIVIR